MAFYRIDDDEEGEEAFEVERISLRSFDELPPELYKELVSRSLTIAKRLKARSEKLHAVLAEQIDAESKPDDMEEAYWRTACVEQMAFFEMQIGNIHDFLQKLLGDQTK